MNKTKNNKVINICILISIVLLIGSLILMLTKNKKTPNHFVEVTYQEYSELIKKDETSIILLTTPTCTHCASYKPYVNYVADENNLTIYNLSINNLSYEEYISVHDKYSVLKDLYKDGTPTILTPTTIIIKNNEEITSSLGNLGYGGFKKILQEYKIIK